jgi:hypothetical protein
MQFLPASCYLILFSPDILLSTLFSNALSVLLLLPETKLNTHTKQQAKVIA